MSIVVAALCLSCAPFMPAAEAAGQTVLRLGYGTWIAAGPLFIAQKKDFFKEVGLKVELVRIDDLEVRQAALEAGRIDALIATVDSLPRLRARGSRRLRYLFALDQSQGGDGLLAVADIDRLAALKGRRVAVASGSAGHFYLKVLLQEAGLAASDLRVVDLEPEAAGRAFAKGEVDAAVTSQPWLALGQAAGERLLDSTAQRPGLIVDALLAPAAASDAERAAFQGLYAAWNKAVTFLKEDPAAASDIMARGLRGAYGEPARLREILKGVEFFDAAANSVYLGRPETPGPLLKVAHQAFDLWLPKAAEGNRPKLVDLIVQGVVE